MVSCRAIFSLVLILSFYPACAQIGRNIPQQPVSASPVLDRILARGELVVGIAPDLPPFIMKSREGKLIGLEADLARYMADAMAVRLRYEVLLFPDLLPALESGKIDMAMSSLTITARRNLKVAFVGPYFISGQTILTKQKTVAAVKDPSQINSPEISIATVRASTSQRFVEKLLPKAKLVLTDSFDEAVKWVREDKVKALIADYPFCIVTVLRYPAEGLVISITPLTHEPIGVALPGNDPLLVNWVGNFLSLLQGSGELDKLKKRWLESGSWVPSFFPDTL